MPNSFTPQQIEQFLQEFFDVVGARQYIGARYVPIFGRAGEGTVEWDDGAPYEPLTVVMHEGVSYVSRRYVPAGIQVTDTDYWVETYRFNAQVEQYRQEVLSFQGQIDQVRADMRSDYVPFPDPDFYPKYGLLGQVLTTLANGNTKWEDPVTVDAEVAGPLIEAWLDDHPEATTTVQDGSITTQKLANGAVTDAKLAQKLVNALAMEITGKQTHTHAFGTTTENWEVPLSLYSGDTVWVRIGASSSLPDTCNYVFYCTGDVTTTITMTNASREWARLRVNANGNLRIYKQQVTASAATMVVEVMTDSNMIERRSVIPRGLIYPGTMSTTAAFDSVLGTHDVLEFPVGMVILDNGGTGISLDNEPEPTRNIAMLYLKLSEYSLGDNHDGDVIFAVGANGAIYNRMRILQVWTPWKRMALSTELDAVSQALDSQTFKTVLTHTFPQDSNANLFTDYAVKAGQQYRIKIGGLVECATSLNVYVRGHEEYNVMRFNHTYYYTPQYDGNLTFFYARVTRFADLITSDVDVTIEIDLCNDDPTQAIDVYEINNTPGHRFVEVLRTIRDEPFSEKHKKRLVLSSGVHDIYAQYMDGVTRGYIQVPPDDISAASYFEPYNLFTPDNCELIGNGIVTLDWTAPNTIPYGAARTWSPLNVRGNCLIRNINIHVKNGRYCIHDDTHNNNPNATHRYENVRCVYDAADVTQQGNLGFNCVVGMGFDNAEWVFDGCDFFFNGSGAHPAFYGHTAGMATIVAKNCAFYSTDSVNGIALRLQSLTSVQGRTIAEFINCLIRSGVEYHLYNADSAQQFDTKLINCGTPTIQYGGPGDPSADIYTTTTLNTFEVAQ